MDIHEYQAKEILSGFGVSVPQGGLAYSPEQAAYRAREIGGDRWVVKAQVHTGGRGKAGGVQVCEDEHAVLDAANDMFGKRLVTEQSGPAGKVVYRVYVEGAVNIEKELYLGLVLDRTTERIMVVASASGGMEIEEVAEKTPELIHKEHFDPAVGLEAYQVRKLCKKLGISGVAARTAFKFLPAMCRFFVDYDCAICEVNPLVITGDDQMIALDAKVSFDENAMFRHKDLESYRDLTEEEPSEVRANDAGLSYVKLDGNIGCLVNGAGLAMSTMDIIKYHNGEPANFLDVGGSASAEQVTEAFQIILSDPNCKGILVNIFGGIARCTTIASAIIEASQKVGFKVPLVVRLEGTEVEEGRKMLEESDVDVITAVDITDAAKKIVAAAG